MENEANNALVLRNGQDVIVKSEKGIYKGRIYFTNDSFYISVNFR